MKNYDEVIRIDVSKRTIDTYCHQSQFYKELVNDVVGYKS
jgi:transposase